MSRFHQVLDGGSEKKNNPKKKKYNFLKNLNVNAAECEFQTLFLFIVSLLDNSPAELNLHRLERLPFLCPSFQPRLLSPSLEWKMSLAHNGTQ